jgi:hypothetical protein
MSWNANRTVSRCGQRMDCMSLASNDEVVWTGERTGPELVSLPGSNVLRQG